MALKTLYPKISYYSVRNLFSSPFPLLEANDFHVWQFSLSDIYDLPCPKTCLSAEELTQLHKYKLESARDCYQIGHVALRSILSGYLHLPPGSFTYITNQYGKLFISQEHSIHFNISHSGEYVVLAFCRFSPVGIDIEEAYSHTLAPSIVKRFFHPEEAKEFLTLTEPLRQEWFFRRWTIREAYVKALGTGLATAPESFFIEEKEENDFSVIPGAVPSFPSEYKQCQEVSPSWHIMKIDAPNGYICSAACLVIK